MFLALLSQGGEAEQVITHVRQDVKNQYDQTTAEGKRDLVREYYVLRQAVDWQVLEEEVFRIFQVRLDALLAQHVLAGLLKVTSTQRLLVFMQRYQ